jgi:hypothetical protein
MNETKEELNFIDWEGRVFGAGYGSGELSIMKVVKIFFGLLENGESYNYECLEEKLGDTITWLLINAFDKGNVIEWGTSSRYGWLTSCGEFVRDFIKGKTPEELYDILMSEHEPICVCDGEIEGHKDCGKNPMVNENFANKLKYGV